MDALKFASSTCKLTCFPFSSFASVGSLWQARHSSLLILGVLAAALGEAAAIAGSNKASTTIQLLRFTKILSRSAKQFRVGWALAPILTI
jgi:hypothetical protein